MKSKTAEAKNYNIGIVRQDGVTYVDLTDVSNILLDWASNENTEVRGRVLTLIGDLQACRTVALDQAKIIAPTEPLKK